MPVENVGIFLAKRRFRVVATSTRDCRKVDEVSAEVVSVPPELVQSYFTATV